MFGNVIKLTVLYIAYVVLYVALYNEIPLKKSSAVTFFVLWLVVLVS